MGSNDDSYFMCFTPTHGSEDRQYASFLTNDLWSDNTQITFAFIEGEHEFITTTVINTFNPLMTRIKFVNIKNYEEAMIRISFNPNEGSWAYIGTKCLDIQTPKPSMNLAVIDERTVLHEFCHVLGMIHEHQNPRRNKIKWNEEKLITWCKEVYGWSYDRTFNNILKYYPIEQTNGSKFDKNSIMLYYFPHSLTVGDVKCQLNTKLSREDIYWINKTYGEIDESCFCFMSYFLESIA